ncbi:MAG: GTPase [Cyanobacteria bacterium J06560_2]
MGEPLDPVPETENIDQALPDPTPIDQVSTDQRSEGQTPAPNHLAQKGPQKGPQKRAQQIAQRVSQGAAALSAALWQGASVRLGEWLPTDAQQLQKAYANAQNRLTQSALKTFSVGDEEVAKILVQVREQLPTTEALLMGKPQSGKSSIVRGLTGVSADIVGQGFRPHTDHTTRYAYPSDDLPLLIFTDTVGLGDIGQETAGIVQELSDELNQESKCARILILTVKITDFAVDQLRQIAQALRQAYPAVPCLLAVTCVHELYPPEQEAHPAYPPRLPEVQRAFSEIQASFEGCFDRSVLLDFTLEEDGYSPVFYGQEALRDALADLLPEAESNAIYQLIDDQEAANAQLGNLYRDVGRRYISAFAVIAATLAAVPLPFATMPVLTALQISMVGLLGKLYGQTLSRSQAGGVASAIAGGFFAQAIGRELVKFIPGFGSVVAASWAAGYTWALGEGACAYFGDLMGGKKPDPERIQRVMATAFEDAKARFRESR